MRLALGKEPAQRGKMCHAVHGMGRREKSGGARLGGFDSIKPEMLVEPRSPRRAQRIAGLQHAAQPGAGAAANEAKMPAALGRHQFENDARFAMPPDAEHDAFIGPLHGVYLICLSSSAKADDPVNIDDAVTTGCPAFAGHDKSLLWKFQSHLPITLRVVAPSFPDFHEQEQMHRLLDGRGNVFARRSPDRLDGLAALAEHDFALAVAFDIDRLFDTHRAVLELLPDLGFDRRLIRQFLMQPKIKLLAGDLGGGMAQRRIRYLILRIEPRAERHARGEPLLEL